MNTEFVPFDLETMDQAISFKTTTGAIVTQITHYPLATSENYVIVCGIGSTLHLFDRLGVHKDDSSVSLLMEVEAKIKFPCLCYVCDFTTEPNHCDHTEVVLLTDCYQEVYIDNTDTRWIYATPLTKDEVSEYLNN
tara:strand:+ start:446 stop:853 length:408 start_codon:yes stop_codon:yes gene_type:complete